VKKQPKSTAGLWLVVIALGVSNCIAHLNARDASRAIDSLRLDAGDARRAIGMVTSCMRWPQHTDNVFCPNPNWTPRE
jgi:hypothetical protein